MILKGATLGMQTKELYQLQPQNIHFNNKTVRIHDNPNNG